MNFFNIIFGDYYNNSKDKVIATPIKKDLTPKEIYYKKLGDILSNNKKDCTTILQKEVSYNLKEVDKIETKIDTVRIKFNEDYYSNEFHWNINLAYNEEDHYYYNNLERRQIHRHKYQYEDRHNTEYLPSVVKSKFQSDMNTLRTKIDLLKKDNTPQKMILILKYQDALQVFIKVTSFLEDKIGWYINNKYNDIYAFDTEGIEIISIVNTKAKQILEWDDSILDIIKDQVVAISENMKIKKQKETELEELEEQRKKDIMYMDKYRALLGLYPMDTDYKKSMDRANEIVSLGNNILKETKEINKLRDLEYGITN